MRLDDIVAGDGEDPESEAAYRHGIFHQDHAMHTACDAIRGARLVWLAHPGSQPVMVYTLRARRRLACFPTLPRVIEGVGAVPLTKGPRAGRAQRDELVAPVLA